MQTGVNPNVIVFHLTNNLFLNLFLNWLSLSNKTNKVKDTHSERLVFNQYLTIERLEIK